MADMQSRGYIPNAKYVKSNNLRFSTFGTDMKRSSLAVPAYQERTVHGSGIIKVIGLFLLLIIVGRLLTGAVNGSVASKLHFMELLSYLKDTPVIPTDWVYAMVTNFSVTFPDWLQWLGAIIDAIIHIVQVGAFTSVSAINLLSFMFYFLVFIFS